MFNYPDCYVIILSAWTADRMICTVSYSVQLKAVTMCCAVFYVVEGVSLDYFQISFFNFSFSNQRLSNDIKCRNTCVSAVGVYVKKMPYL